MNASFLYKFFSKVLRTTKEALREKPLIVSTQEEHFLALQSGKKHLLTREYLEGTNSASRKEKRELEKRLCEIERRLSTLETETT